LLDWGMNYVTRTGDLSVEERARIALPVLLGLNSHGGGGRPDERMLQLTRILENSPDAAVYLGRFWHNRAHGDRAREHYQIAYTHALLLNDHARAVEAAAWLAESEAVIGNLRTAEQILKDLEQHYLPARLPRSIRRTYYYVYGYYHYQRGRFRRSRELYLKALDNSDRCPDVLRELSRVEMEFGNYQYAYRLAEEALNQLMLDKTEPHEASIHALKGCLGDLCAVMERYDDALVYHAPCLDFWQAIEQPRWICWTLNRLVEIELLARDARRSWRLHHSFGRSAGELLREAWEVIQPTYMNLPHKARTLHNLGWFAWHEGRLDAAEYYLEQALTMRQQYGAEYGVARTQETLARVRVAQGRPREARALFEAAAQFRARGRTRLYPQIRSCNRAIQNRLR
ncbi:MAG: tetratricopeptide repeat protein, partial [Fimbriimonadales bacterium]|nr:tetratricopeptide repeat protein [Fimbriimonadales bacterium]